MYSIVISLFLSQSHTHLLVLSKITACDLSSQLVAEFGGLQMFR